MKKRFKKTYLERHDTGRVLINIASTEYLRNNSTEALRYYEHALAVLKACRDPSVTVQIDLGKAHVSIAEIERHRGDNRTAFCHYGKANVSSPKAFKLGFVRV